MHRGVLSTKVRNITWKRDFWSWGFHCLLTARNDKNIVPVLHDEERDTRKTFLAREFPQGNLTIIYRKYVLVSYIIAVSMEIL